MEDVIILVSILVGLSLLVYSLKKVSDKNRQRMMDEIEDLEEEN